MAESLKAAIAAGRPLMGTVLTLPDVGTAELLAEPFDLVWIDLEHGALGPREAQEMIIGAQASGAYALVRLPARAGGLITAVLDAGADGVVIADVRDPSTVERIALSLCHPPEGIRGWGPRRLGLRDRAETGPRPEPSLWIQIESAAAVEEIEAIAVVAGVDVICVGTADLSFSLGAPLRMDHPGLLGAVSSVRAAAAARGVAFALAGSLDASPPSIFQGAQILVHSTDARLCAGAVDSAAEWMRQALETKKESTPR